MLIKLDSPKVLLDAISIISELVSDVRIRVEKDSLKIVAIDPANVAMVFFKMNASAFSQFEVDEEKLGINLDALKSVIRRGSKGGSVLISKKENYLGVEIQDKIKRNFTIALIDIDAEEKDMPQLEFTNKIEMDVQGFVEAIEDSCIVSDACSFIGQDGNFIIEASGLNSARAEFSGDEANIKSENAKARYSLEYMKKFLNASKLSDKVLIQFSENYPLKLEFKGKDTEMSFVLAPRWETED